MVLLVDDLRRGMSSKEHTRTEADDYCLNSVGFLKEGSQGLVDWDRCHGEGTRCGFDLCKKVGDGIIERSIDLV